MKVGVVIPTHNRAALVSEAIESVLTQTAPPEEVVVVDDGSSDRTAEAVAAFGSQGVRYLFQENAFQSAARNRGMQSLSPALDAVLFLDDDDRLLPDALERLTAALSAAPEAPLAYGRPRYIGAAGEALDQSWGMEDVEGSGVYQRLIHRNFICTTGCALLRRSALEAVGEWDTALRGTEDWDLWLRLCENGAPFVRVAQPERPVLEYRLQPGSVSKNRARMQENERAVCCKHRDRAEPGSPRWQTWEREGIRRREGRNPRHRWLRETLTRLRLEEQYRRAPLWLRLHLRSLFGIDRWAE